MKTKTLNHDKVHFWLDTQTAKQIDPIQSVPAHLRAEFLTIIEKREDYAYNGLKLVAVGYTEEIVEHWENRTEYTVSRTPKAEARS